MAFPRRLLSHSEQLVMDLRPHWVALVWPVVETVLDAAAAVALLILLHRQPAWLRLAVVALAVVVFVVLALPAIVHWATSHFVVTSDRVIHRAGLVSKRSMEIPLENISDVRFHQGVFERVIGAGDLTLESPGTFGQETFDHIRNPELVQKTIYQLNEANVHRARGGGAPSSSSVADEIAKLDQLRRQGVISDQDFERQKARLLNPG